MNRQDKIRKEKKIQIETERKRERMSFSCKRALALSHDDTPRGIILRYDIVLL